MTILETDACNAIIRINKSIGSMPSKRDYFAGLALQKLLTEDTPDTSYDMIAEDSYKIADAMIKASKKLNN